MESYDDDLGEPLIDRFVRARSNEIEYRGHSLFSAYKLEQVSHGAVIRIRWIHAKSNPTQGLQLHSRPGALEIEGHASKHVVLWRDTAPDHVTLRVVSKPRTKPTDIIIRNTWKQSRGETKTSLGNAGIMVNNIGDELILNCSDGDGPPQFDDLVVALQIVT
jgi:hypothetical protein